MFTMICAAALAVCGIAGAASSGDRMKVHFDYPVAAGDVVLPAGDVTIQMLDPVNDASGVLLVRSASGVETTLLTNRIDPSNAPKSEASVTLSHSGNTYRLQNVWLSQTTGFQILEPAK
jgi:hypothetical protein